MADVVRAISGFGRQEYELTQQLVERLAVHGVRIIAIDELHFVRGDRMGDKMVNHLKVLMNLTTAAFVMAGVTKVRGAVPLLRQGGKSPTDEQLRRRFTTIDFEPFRMDPDATHGASGDGGPWRSAVSQLTVRLKLLNLDPAWWTESSTLEYLWKRTGGVFADLVRLIEKAGSKAIGKSETLSVAALESIRLSDAADVAAAASFGIGPRAAATPVPRRGRHAAGTSKAGKESAANVARSGVQRGDALAVRDHGGLIR